MGTECEELAGGRREPVVPRYRVSEGPLWKASSRTGVTAALHPHLQCRPAALELERHQTPPWGCQPHPEAGL